MATLDDLRRRLSKLRNVKRFGCPAITACCPAHDDSTPSFYAWEGEDGWLHVRCARCSEAEILRALGWEVRDLRMEDCAYTPSERPMAPVEYVYRDSLGQPVIRKTRLPKRGASGELKKTFVLEGIQAGQWVYGLGHMNGEKVTLYQLPELLAHKGSKTIYVVNGEKAADRLRAAKLLATCQPFGEGSNAGEARGMWKPGHTKFLEGAFHVVVVADLDEVGEAYASFVASQLTGHVGRVEVVQSATGRPKDDAFDHFEAGFGVEQFVSRSDLGPRRGFALRRFPAEGFEPVAPEWLIEPYLFRGKTCLLDADGGVGKSSLALAWAAALSRGLHPLTFVPLAEGPVRTLYLHKGEDEEAELETVYRANHGAPGYLEYAGEEVCFDTPGLRQVEEAVQDGRFGLVIVDALFYFLAGAVRDPNAPMDVMAVIGAMNRIASRTRASFLNIRHTRKLVPGTPAAEGGMGSQAFKNSHRGLLLARKHPDKRGVVVVTDERASIMRPQAGHFMFRRIDNEIQYLATDEPNPFADQNRGGRPSERRDGAEAWLKEFFGSRTVIPQEDVMCALEREGFQYRTAYRALQTLGGHSTKRGFSDGRYRWFLEVPQEDPFA